MPRLADLHHSVDTGRAGFELDPTDESFADTAVSDSYADSRVIRSFADSRGMEDFADTTSSEHDLELEAAGKVPKLKPRPIGPKKLYAPVVALKKIERIEINAYKVISGVVFYVMDVFLEHPTSRIPTLALRQQQAVKRTRTRSARARSHRRPDYRVLRRFSDFEKMRKYVGRFARSQVLGACPYCDALRIFLATCYSEPVPIVKLFRKNPEARMGLLERFVNRMVQLSIGRVSSTANWQLQHQEMCAGFNAVPTLVDQFVRPQSLC